MPKKLFILPAFLAVVFSCNASVVGSNRISLGDADFCIPDWHNLLDQTTGPIFNIAGADVVGGRSGSFQVSIDPGEVKKSIPGYLVNDGGLPASFIINVRQASVGQLEKVMGPKYYADTLRLVNDYENAKIEYDKVNNFYRVSNWGGSPPFVLWEVLKVKPKKGAVVPESLGDYYIASCSRAGGTTGMNGAGSICDYSVGIDNYLVRIITTENNLNLKEKLTAYVEGRLMSWRKACH